jgi:hypothetical protein
MPALHNTPEPAATGACAVVRRVWRLPEALPPASGADRLLAAWRAAWPHEAPWLLLAPEARAAAWADALRAALLAGPPVVFPAAELRRLVRAGAGAGAALICGGLPADEVGGAVRPALFALAPPVPALLRAWSTPAPLLGIAAREPHEPLDASGLIFEECSA